MSTNDSWLGRCEMHNHASNTHKFWAVLRQHNGLYVIRWGRVGAAGQSQRNVSREVAYARKMQKLQKGYLDVQGYPCSEQQEEERDCLKIASHLRADQAAVPPPSQKTSARSGL